MDINVIKKAIESVLKDCKKHEGRLGEDPTLREDDDIRGPLFWYLKDNTKIRTIREYKQLFPYYSTYHYNKKNHDWIGRNVNVDIALKENVGEKEQRVFIEIVSPSITSNETEKNKKNKPGRQASWDVEKLICQLDNQDKLKNGGKVEIPYCFCIWYIPETWNFTIKEIKGFLEKQLNEIPQPEKSNIEEWQKQQDEWKQIKKYIYEKDSFEKIKICIYPKNDDMKWFKLKYDGAEFSLEEEND